MAHMRAHHFQQEPKTSNTAALSIAAVISALVLGLAFVVWSMLPVQIEQNTLSADSALEGIQNHQYLEDSLARTLSELKGIETARVHLAIDEQGSEHSKATVFIQTAPLAFSEHLTDRITTLLTSTVPSLLRSEVTIINQQGELVLSNTDQPINGASAALVFKSALENTFARRIENLLTPIIGHGKVHANVTTTLDMNVIEHVSEGVETSLDSSKQFQKITENQVPGRIQQISAAVVVDDRVEQLEDGSIERLPRTEEEIDEIASLVRSAIGYSNARGDVVTVVNKPFAELMPLAKQEPLKFYQHAWFPQLTKQIAAALALVLLLVYIIRPVLKQSEATSNATSEQIQKIIDHINNQQVVEEGPRMDGSGSTPIRQLVKRDPKRVASVMMNWIEQDKSNGK